MKPVNVIIECPKNSGQKYNYVPEMQCFKLTKLLPAGLVFPFDFGFIPGTKGDDGDPLDVIVVSEMKSFVGCCMDCRIVGAIKAEQTEENGETVRNDRYLAIPQVSQQFKEVGSIGQLPRDVIKQVERFFQNYNDQAGKQFKVIDNVDAGEAYRMIEKQKAADKEQ